MNFVDWVERHRRSLLFVAVALTVAGVFAGVKLPIGLFPTVSFPRIRVEVDSGSMPAKQMLVDVTEPLEEVGRAVPGAVNVESTTSRGSAEIFIDFPWGSDMQRALLRVDAAFAQKLPDLPSGTGYDVLQMSPNAIMPFISFALISKTVPTAQLHQLAKFEITPLLEGIKGVRKVGIIGGQTPEVQVTLSPEKLRAYGLNVADVSQAIADTNSLSSVGRIEDNDLLYLTINNSAFTSVKSVEDVTLRSPKGGIVRLGDIATVKMGSKPQWLLVNDNGQPSVNFNVYQQDTASSVELAKEVEARLNDFMKLQPSSIHLYKWYDQTELVRSSIGAVEEAIVIGLVFAALVILGFLRNWRATLVAMLVVPMSVIITIMLLALLGMSFNIMTLGGIAAAIGLLIDDAIVMIEQIARRAGVPGHPDPKRLVLGSAQEFLAPLTGSSLATIIMFIPLAFLGGITGAFFKFLSLTMAASLIISYLLSALLVPLLARGLINFSKWHDPSHGKETFSRRVHGTVLRRLAAWPWLIVVMVGGVVFAGYFGYNHVGTGFLPKMDEGGFVLDYQAAPGTSLTETNRELEEVEAILKKNPYVYTFSRRTGAGLGGNLIEAYAGDFFVRLIDPSKRPPIGKIMDKITADVTSTVPGVSFDTHQLLGDMIGDMVGRRQPVVITLKAKDPSILGDVAQKVATAIAKVPGVEPASVNNGVVPAGDALEIKVDPAAAAVNGVTPAEVKTQVDRYLHGTVVTRYLGSVQDVGVRVWSHAPFSKVTRDNLNQLPLHAPDGHVFTLQSVAKIKFVAGQPELTRENLAQIVAVTAEISSGHDLGSTIKNVRKVLDQPGMLPSGVYYEIGGAYKQQQIAARGMMQVATAAIIAEFILLLFLYERFSVPIIIIASSLISTGAVFIGLWLTHVELNITAMMGMVMVIGIATEMAIFLVSEYQMLEKEMPSRQAIYEAALNRLRPIIMSTVAMILALLPLGAAVSGSGDQMLQPLAIAIIAGITVQLPLVLLAMPVVIGLTAREGRVPAVSSIKKKTKRLMGAFEEDPAE
ncbi:MAG: efflux RND transporter permease subunit [Beijerinckiaceae bacterium]|nr:MAG: efflux RND transporter permease subunit [Beijerinckiaceae bacterium]